MPSNYALKGIAAYEVSKLNILTYYGLVLSSFTGISTMVGATKFLEAAEDLDNGLNEKCPEINNEIKSYLNMEGNCRVVRLFEYNFLLPAIHVKMFHLMGNDGKLSLVEIYSADHRMYTIWMCLGMAVSSMVISKKLLHS